MKIVYILPSLEPSGGAERVITEKANYFANFFGYEVYIINLYQHNDSPNYYPLSGKVQQINLGIPSHLQYKYKYPKRLWIKYRFNIEERKAITRLIEDINPDIIIGVSYSKADLVSTIKSRAKIIIECHEVKYFDSLSIFSRSILSKIFHNYFYYRYIEKNADLVVTLTHQAKQQWKKAKRVEVIPNFSLIPVKQYSNCEKKRIIAVGRLCEEKGFERLLTIWKVVSSKFPDWQLAIFGEGKLKNKLNNIIDTEHMKNVILYGTTKDIGKEYSDSSICVVTSYYEGFSLVTLEAMKFGLPCVAFDCPYGPRNIIEDHKNGFLVENGNNKLFIEKLCCLIENNNLRFDFSKSAIETAEHFNTDIVMNQWKSLFEELNET